MIKTTLVDARNFDSIVPIIMDRVSKAPFTGLDIETDDRDTAHSGIKKFRGNDPSPFDFRRMIITGLSLYPDETDESFYINLHHADVENRVPWGDVKPLVDAIGGYTLCHNAPFEIASFKSVFDYLLERVICTLQLSVSCYGADEYDVNEFKSCKLGQITKLIPQIREVYGPRAMHIVNGLTEMKYEPLSSEEQQLLGKVIGKDSKAAFSYNGLVKDLAYGHGLKQAVKSFFGYKMTTYEEVTGKRSMGQLTGEEVARYGCDDAYWCVRLFHRLLEMLRPELVDTFFKQENPMIYVYADSSINGIRLDHDNIIRSRDRERANTAELLRRMKAAVLRCFPFPADKNEKLADRDSWYANGWQKYRRRISDWATSPNFNDDLEQVKQISGAIREAWAGNKGTGPNFTHYMMIRTLIYDLFDRKPVVVDGKTQSDKELRVELLKKLTDPNQIEVLTCINELATAEQAMKLYLTPYDQLVDPDTDRVYPSLTSQLVTRRMAGNDPNLMQQAKRGPTAYVRGFCKGDTDDHLIVSGDWSQVELVEVGEFSGDPAFKEAFGQLPYKDLHTRAAARCLKMTVDELKASKDYKKLRTEVGKGANFNYWYSGSLSTVGEKLGWTSEEMWEATEIYRTEFAVAEAWRVEQIAKIMRDGYVELPDGHRRVRYEATDDWLMDWMTLWQTMDPLFTTFAGYAAKSIQRRAKNQAVNAKIQGTCATIAKRSILSNRENIDKKKYNARFLFPSHDELVFSVHKAEVVDFVEDLRHIMCDHKDIFPTLPLHCTVSIGKNFQPFDKENAPFGQVELDELPGILGFVKDSVANDNQIRQIVDYMYADTTEKYRKAI